MSIRKPKTDRTIKVKPESERTMGMFERKDNESVPPVNFDDVRKAFNITNSVPTSHYASVHTIGFGGVGLVVSAHDPNLDRDVAIKMLRPEIKNKPTEIERFVREARATANIEHPNVIPVHEMGVMNGVGVYFTMKKIKGDNFQTVLDGLKNRKKEYEGKYTRLQLLEIFISICNGVAYAHSRKIIHRDLKPHNVLIGDYGEVLVMDWGLAKYLAADDPETSSMKQEASKMEYVIKAGDSSKTIDGTISGTPNYMPPEQAEGKVSELDERTDIYSLGAILYQILTYEPPYSGEDIHKVLEDVRHWTFIHPRRRFPKYRIPRELEAICLKAMAFDKKARYRSVQELISDIRNYIEGFSVTAYPDSTFVRFRKLCFRHPVLSSTFASIFLIVLTVVALYFTFTYVQFKTLMKMAEENLRDGNAKLREAVGTYRKIEKLEEGKILKEKSDSLLDLEDKLSRLYSSSENHYETALMLYSAVPFRYRNHYLVNEGFREIMFNRISFSIMTKNYQKIEKWIELLRLWMGQNFEELPESDRKKLFQIENDIKGDGQLKLSVRPVPEEITLFSLVDKGDGRLVQSNPRVLENALSAPFAIPKGTYLLVFKTKDFPEVKVDFIIDHGEKDEIGVIIPKSIPEDMVFVPGGKFYTGGENARYYSMHEEDIPSFFISRYELTYGEYLKFWKSLDSPDEKARHMSRIMLDPMERVFHDAWDSEGRLISPLKPELPVVGILHESAEAYCAWLGGKTGRKILLPTAMQWEKAARGADGRLFPWGNGFNANFANISENKEARTRYGFWAPPGSFPMDVSVYGAFDMGGNVREMTSSRFPDSSAFYQIKGASCSTGRRFLYCEYSSDTPVVPSDVGFRYVMQVEEKK